jgi:PIN domain nuclease of toxin-antitoxin system
VKPRYLLDTHALAWAVLSPEKLGAKARRVISDAKAGDIAVSSATIIELGRLIDADEFSMKTRRPSDVFDPALKFYPVLPTSLAAAISAPVLRLPHSDPYDRLIVAEALALGVPLITKDGNITDSGIVRVIW